MGASLFSCLMAKTDNFCHDLEDWGEPYSRKVEVTLCKSVLEKKCMERSEHMCMEVTEVDCEVSSESESEATLTFNLKVELFSKCSLDWEEHQGQDYSFLMKNATLKTCHKMTKNIVQEKTVHRCENVTRQHCATVWREDETGRKVWAGKEEDCKDVTWEECKEHKVNVTIPAPGMNCTDTYQPYLDYEKKNVTLKADNMNCSVEKRPVCKPVKKLKCGQISLTECEEVMEAVKIKKKNYNFRF